MTFRAFLLIGATEALARLYMWGYLPATDPNRVKVWRQDGIYPQTISLGGPWAVIFER